MIEATFIECFSWLKKFHGKQLITPAAEDKFKAAFMDVDDKVFCEAANLATEKLAPGNFPTVERMRGFVAEGREILVAKAKAAESKTPISRSRLPDLRNISHAKDSFALIRRIFFPEADQPRLSAEEKYKAMMEMEKKYPGKGWEAAAKEYRRWCERPKHDPRVLFASETKEDPDGL